MKNVMIVILLYAMIANKLSKKVTRSLDVKDVIGTYVKIVISKTIQTIIS